MMEMFLFLAAVVGTTFFIRGIYALGWAPLISFHATEAPQGYTFKGIFGKVGWCGFGQLTIIVADAGLYMKPSPVHALFTKPVLIPWTAFGPSEEKTVLLTSTLYTTARTPEGQDIPLQFRNIELHGYLLKKLPGPDAPPLKTAPPIALPDVEQ